MKIPHHVQSILWDVAPGQINLRRHQRFVIARIVEKGSWRDVAWLRRVFPLAVIKKVALTSKNTSARVKSFWKKI